MTDENKQPPQQDNEPIAIPSALPGAEFLGYTEMPEDEEGIEGIVIENSDLPEHAFRGFTAIAGFVERLSHELREAADARDGINFFNILTSGTEALVQMTESTNEAMTATAMLKTLLNGTTEDSTDDPSRN